MSDFGAVFRQLEQPARVLPDRRDNRLQPDSKVGQLRACLAQGDATAEELRAAVGLENTRFVWGLLKADMENGRVTRVGNNFHLNAEDWRDLLPEDQAAAVALLEANGFRVQRVRKGVRRA